MSVRTKIHLLAKIAGGWSLRTMLPHTPQSTGERVRTQPLGVLALDLVVIVNDLSMTWWLKSSSAATDPEESWAKCHRDC